MSRCLVHSQPLDTGMRCAQCDNSLRTGFFAGIPVRISEHVPEGAFFMAKDGKIVDIGLEQARLIAQLTAERDALKTALDAEEHRHGDDVVALRDARAERDALKAENESLQRVATDLSLRAAPLHSQEDASLGFNLNGRPVIVRGTPEDCTAVRDSLMDMGHSLTVANTNVAGMVDLLRKMVAGDPSAAAEAQRVLEAVNANGGSVLLHPTSTEGEK